MERQEAADLAAALTRYGTPAEVVAGNVRIRDSGDMVTHNEMDGFVWGPSREHQLVSAHSEYAVAREILDERVACELCAEQLDKRARARR